MLITLLFLLTVILSCCSPYIRRWAETRAKKDFPLQPGEESEAFEKPEWEPLPDTGETVPEMLFREMEAEFPVIDEDLEESDLHDIILGMLAMRDEDDCADMSSGEMIAFVFLSPISRRWVQLTPDRERRLALAERWEKFLRGKNLHLTVLEHSFSENMTDAGRAEISDLVETQQEATNGGEPLELLALAAREVAEGVCGKNGCKCVAVTWSGYTDTDKPSPPMMSILAEKTQG